MDNSEHPLKTATIKVLEDWAMMLIEDLPLVSVDTFNNEMPIFMSWINLHGNISGAVSIVAQKEFMQTLARNLLGQDPDEPLSEDECTDAFKEMGNVLAGNFITEAYGEEIVFDLIHPNVTEIPQTDLARFTNRNIVFGFMADDSPVAVSFSIKKTQ